MSARNRKRGPVSLGAAREDQDGLYEDGYDDDEGTCCCGGGAMMEGSEKMWSYACAGCTMFLLLIVLALSVTITVTVVGAENDVDWLRSYTPVENSKCANDAGNTCLVPAYIPSLGACTSYFKPDGEECSSVCYASGTELACDGGTCKGKEGCLGTCIDDTNCTAHPLNFTSAPDATTCGSGNTCQYSFYNQTSPVPFATHDGCQGAVYQEACLALVNGTATIYKPCLEAYTFCSAGGDKFDCLIRWACSVVQVDSS